MANFIKALNLVLNDMIEANPDNLCMAVYHDDMCVDNAIVMFMEYENYENMHAVMKDLHVRLSEKMGWPVCICHNNPTDESVLIHGHSDDASVYYTDECCKRRGIEICLTFLKQGTGYSDFYQSIAIGAEAYALMCGRSTEYVLNTLNWDEDVQAQLIRLMAEAYDFNKA
jgi:hypothetical protein